MLTSSGQPNVVLWPSLGPTKGFESNIACSSSDGVRPKSTIANRMSDLEFDEIEDDLPRVPEFRCSFGAAIAEALNKSTTAKTASLEMGNGGSKKKKNKKTILFTTSARPFNGP